MTRSLTRLQAISLGCVVLLGVALTTLGVFAVGGRQWLWDETFHLRAGFRRIQGVEIGTRVRILGKEAGEVEKIELPTKPSGDVTLVLRIDGRLRYLLRSDACAQIVPEGMVGGKVVEIHPGSDDKESIEDHAIIATRPSTELSDILVRADHAIDEAKGSLTQTSQKLTNVLVQTDNLLNEVRQGRGTLGKFIKDDGMYSESLRVLQQFRRTMVSLQQNSDAMKELPLVRNYVTDAHKELVRPDCERNRKYFQEDELFEPGQAILTADGRKKLDELAPWLEEQKYKGSEVVIASYAHASLEPALARTLTQKQCETISEYLTTNHKIHKMGWFSRRRVVPVGCGIDPPPVPEKEKLPTPRIEVLVFVPQT